MNNLTAAVLKESAIRDQIDEEMKRHRRQIGMLTRELQSAQHLVDVFKNGIDGDKYELALSVMKLNTKYMGGEAKEVIRRVINDIANGCKLLKNSYFGTKNYDRWIGQAFTCSYGYGPTHGYEVFSISLKPDARKRNLTEDEADACIYTLLHLAEGKIPASIS